MNDELTRQAERHPERHFGHEVVVSNVSPGAMATCTAQSIASAYRQDGQLPLDDKILTGPFGGDIFLQSGPRIAEARSQVVDHFLTRWGPEAGWLLTIDSDMDFTYDDLRALHAVADPKERPIVGGLCFAGSDPTNMYPTVYSSSRTGDGKAHIDIVYDYPTDTLCKVGATGAAFCLIHRSVFLRMRQPHPRGFGTLPDGKPNAYPWYVEGHVDQHGRPFGEDIAFCMRAAAMGMDTWVHTGIRIGHRKSIILDEQLYNPDRAATTREQEPVTS